MVTAPVVCAVVAGIVAALGECVHRRHFRRAVALAFGPEGRARLWTSAAPVLRVASVALVTWGFAAMLAESASSVPAEGPDGRASERRLKQLVIVLDVTGSMSLPDGGPGGETRLDWACSRLWSLLEGLPEGAFRTTVLAVGTGMQPVVVETADLGVVRNILDGLPLEYAFERRYTDLYGGLRDALAFCHRWNPRSTTMVLISDGDTGDRSQLVCPASVEQFLVLGAGSPEGRQIGSYLSRQQCDNLEAIADGLNGPIKTGYINCSSTEIPTTILHHLSSSTALPSARGGSVGPALGALLGSVLLSSLPVALAVWGSSWRAGVRPAPQHGSWFRVQAARRFGRLYAASRDLVFHRQRRRMEEEPPRA
jgi:hypothetical protein